MENNILDDVYEGMVVLDGFNDCILGRITQSQTEPKILYSIKCILSKLMADDIVTGKQIGRAHV